MTQKGGLFGLVTKKSLKKDQFQVFFFHNFNANTYNLINDRELLQLYTDSERKELYDVSFKYFKNTKTSILMTIKNQLKTIPKIANRFLRGYAKQSLQMNKYESNLWEIYDNNKIIKELRVSYIQAGISLNDKFIKKHLIDRNKNNQKFNKLPTKIRFKAYDIVSNFRVSNVYMDPETHHQSNDIAEYESDTIISNVLYFYISKNLSYDDVFGIYDLLSGEMIDNMMDEEILTVRQYKEIERYGGKLWKQLAKFLVIGDVDPMVSKLAMERKKKIQKEKEKMKKLQKDAAKRAKEAAKKQLEKQKNRKKNLECKNESDFITLEDIEDIPKEDIVTIKLGKTIFCYEKDSFKNLVKYAKDQKVRGNCKPAIPGKPLECDFFYPINMGNNVYISEINYNILRKALKIKNDHRKYELRNKRVVDFTTGLHIMSQKSGKDNVYDLVPEGFNGGGRKKYKYKKVIIKKNKSKK